MAVEWVTSADLSSPAEPLAEDAASAASWILYRLSGQRYPGIRYTTEWYGYDHVNCWCSSNPEADFSLRAHDIVTLPTQQTQTQLRLRHKPVQSIINVTDATGVLDESLFDLVNDAYLIKSDRSGWDFSSGIEVKYKYGTPPPPMGRNAAIRLGNELLSLYTNSSSCQLPERVTSVSRQGMSMTILDPQDFINEGRTGIYEIDMFLAVANPSGAKKRAKVFSPDKPRGERRR